MTRLLKALLFTALLACAAAAPTVAGPNAGGIIIAHDANLLVSSADGGVSLCGQGTVPADCQAADTELDGAGNLEGDQAVFLVYAAFFPGSSPRLMGVTWGVSYDAGNIVLPNYGKCGDFELNDEGWPAPGKGSTVIWNAPQTAILVPVYWFAAYTYGSPGSFDLGPSPSQGGVFGDDGIPAVLDPIAAYGKLGFDMPGSLPCPDATPGACCAPDGSCSVTPQALCALPNVWQGPGTVCTPNPCPQLSGACCYPDGTCVLTTQADCTWPNIWQGPNTSCDPNPCPQPGACCTPDGTCTITFQSECHGLWMGVNTSCIPDPCPPPGACCAPNGTCTITLQSLCNDDWLGPDASCDPNPCPQPPVGACCYPDGHCVFSTQADCPTGDWHINVPCEPNPCQPWPTGACCIGTLCTITTEPGCAGRWTGPDTVCLPNPCCPSTPPGPLSASQDTTTTRAVGPGQTVNAPPGTRTICPGSTFKSNDDGSYENGYAWAYGGVTPPYYGAWAEGFTMTSVLDCVCGVKFALTQVGCQDGWLMDVYVWSGNAGSPESVVCVTTGVNPGAIGMWPTITLHDIDIADCCVTGEYFVGWWPNWVGTGNGWYVASDENGFAGGLPRTNIAPGLGYPTGWNHPNMVSNFAGCQDLGIGVYEFACGCGTPTERMSWGRLKALYR